MDILLYYGTGAGWMFALLYFFKKNGILDPVYPIFMFIPLLLLDVVFKLCVYDSMIDVDSYFVICFGIESVLFAITYLLCKRILPNLQNRRMRKTSPNVNYFRLGILLTCVGVIYALFISVWLFHTFTWEDDGRALFIIVYSPLCIVVACYSVALKLFRYERIKHEVKRTIQSLITKRAPLIFLRSFELDKYPVFGKTFDEYICQRFSLTAQPIISLSDPDEFLPTGGSIKIQSCDDKWKDVIITLFRNCRAVIIFEGTSDGLQWEIENLKKYISHDQLYVVTPLFKYRMRAWYQCHSITILFHKLFSRKSIRQTLGFVWSKFATHLCNEGITISTSLPDSNQIFAFDENWNSINVEKGMSENALFDTVLQNTVKYEKTECDYRKIGECLHEYEITQSITNEERSAIKKSAVYISAIVVFIFIILCVFL